MPKVPSPLGPKSVGASSIIGQSGLLALRPHQVTWAETDTNWPFALGIPREGDFGPDTTIAAHSRLLVAKERHWLELA